MSVFTCNVAVNDLDRSISFYSAMFGKEPSVVKSDYAKWMLEDPRINFAISNRGQTAGVNHLGMQAEDDANLKPSTPTCKRQTPQSWRRKAPVAVTQSPTSTGSTDPQGIAWESFRSLGTIPLFGSAGSVVSATTESPSCGAEPSAAPSCCSPIDQEVVPITKSAGERPVSLHSQLGAEHYGGGDR